jgi:hypothetical protein
VKKSFAYARLPRAGIGNKLLVWARALVFAHLNDMPLSVSNWAEIKIGPFLRNEKNKRQYWGYFNTENCPGFLKKLFFLCWFRKIHEPAIVQIASSTRQKTLYLFEKTPPWSDYFKDIRAYRGLIKSALYEIISPKYIVLMDSKKPPVVGVHIRRSDFREAQPGEDLGSACNIRTPLAYYVRTIGIIRRVYGEDLPVTIFTDGREEEISDLLALPEVRLAEPNPDIIDFLLLSRSKCIVVSSGSTFSYWAAFLSDAPVVMHPQHPVLIRPDAMKLEIFEGPVSDREKLSELFIRNIRSIDF